MRLDFYIPNILRPCGAVWSRPISCFFVNFSDFLFIFRLLLYMNIDGFFLNLAHISSMRYFWVQKKFCSKFVYYFNALNIFGSFTKLHFFRNYRLRKKKPIPRKNSYCDCYLDFLWHERESRNSKDRLLTPLAYRMEPEPSAHGNTFPLPTRKSENCCYCRNQKPKLLLVCKRKRRKR